MGRSEKPARGSAADQGVRPSTRGGKLATTLPRLLDLLPPRDPLLAAEHVRTYFNQPRQQAKDRRRRPHGAIACPKIAAVEMFGDLREPVILDDLFHDHQQHFELGGILLEVHSVAR